MNASVLFLSVIGLSLPALAGSDTAVPSPPMSIVEREEAVRAAVRTLANDEAGNRVRGAVMRMTWGTLLTFVGSQGVTYGLSHRQILLSYPSGILLGAGLLELTIGVFDLTWVEPTEAKANELLNDPELLRQSGTAHLVERRDSARRARFREGAVALLEAISGAIVSIPLFGDRTVFGYSLGAVASVGGLIQLVRSLVLFLTPTKEERLVGEVGRLLAADPVDAHPVLGVGPAGTIFGGLAISGSF